MKTFKVQIIEVFKTTRRIVIEVEHDDLDSAIEEVTSGSMDLPSFDDPRWVTHWDLQNEEVTEA